MFWLDVACGSILVFSIVNKSAVLKTSWAASMGMIVFLSNALTPVRARVPECQSDSEPFYARINGLMH